MKKVYKCSCGAEYLADEEYTECPHTEEDFTVYDDGEAETPGDPLIEEVNEEDLVTLYGTVGSLEGMENPIEKEKAVKEFVEELNRED